MNEPASLQTQIVQSRERFRPNIAIGVQAHDASRRTHALRHQPHDLAGTATGIQAPHPLRQPCPFEDGSGHRL
jgi:hypothetical protein